MSAEQIDVRLFVFVIEVAEDYAQVSFDIPVLDYSIKVVDIPFCLENSGDIIEGEIKHMVQTG